MIYKNLILFTLSLAVLTGCQKKEIVFEGKVLEGIWNEDLNRVDVEGVVPGAKIWDELNPSVYAVSDANGEYSLTLESSFTLGALPMKEYKLISAGGNGFDDRVTVYGIIGKTNQVRDFLLYEHYKETWD